MYIAPGAPWENSYADSFHGMLRDELLACEVFDSLHDVRRLAAAWREVNNHRRPRGGLGWQTPAAYAAKLVDRQAGVFPTAPRIESPVRATPFPPTQYAN